MNTANWFISPVIQKNWRTILGRTREIRTISPLCFEREVLRRYRDDLENYDVQEITLQRGMRWGLSIENSHIHDVTAYLGDLGCDLPAVERNHWKAHNIWPIFRLKDADLEVEGHNRKKVGLNPEFRFKRRYSEVNLWTLACWDIPLYRAIQEGEKQILSRMRISLNQTQTELESQILALTKLLIDQLNVKEMKKVIGSLNDERSLGSLKRFLEAKESPFVERDITFLHRLQRFRSQLNAHATGDSGQKLLQKSRGDRDNISFYRSIG